MSLFVDWSEDFAHSITTKHWDYQYSFILLTFGWLLQVLPGVALVFTAFAHRIMCCCPDVWARHSTGFGG